MKKYSKLLAILVVLTLVLTACGSKEDNLFRVGMEAAYPPFNWTQLDDSNGAVKIEGNDEYAGGYDVEFAKKIAEGLGKKLVIVKTEWDGLPPGVQSGKIDAIIAGMSPTEERKQVIDFSDVYYTSDLVVVVKKGSPFEQAKTLAELSGAKLTGQLNTFHYTVIDQIPGVVKDVALENFATMRVALQAGSIDGYVSERPEAISATSANPDLTFVTFDEGKGFATDTDDTAIAVGVKKDSPLTEKINEILKGISEEERKTIMDNAIKNQPSEQATQSE